MKKCVSTNQNFKVYLIIFSDFSKKAMLVFDRRSLRCVVPPTEDCEVPTTQLPLEGDENGPPGPPGRNNGNNQQQQQQQQQFQERDDEALPLLLKGTFNRNNNNNNN